MSDEHDEKRGDDAEEVYELEAEDGLEDKDAILREAVEAVGEPGPAEDAPEAEVGNELEELRERYLRTVADFENYRKRVQKERGEAARFAAAEPLREFLTVVDNLDRALAAEGSREDLKAGVEMILRHMKELLRRFGVEAVPAEGERFDPTVHEAVARFEDPGVEYQKVTEELQKGYMLHDRLLRPSMVKVAVPAEGETAERPGDARE